MKRMRGRRMVMGIAAGTVAAGLAVLWLFVVPGKANEATGIQSLVIRYGHSLCWALLSAASVLYAVHAPRRVVESAAWLGLAAYVAFLLALFV